MPSCVCLLDGVVGSGGIDEYPQRTPASIRIPVRLLAQSQSFKLAIIKSEVLYQILTAPPDDEDTNHQNCQCRNDESSQPSCAVASPATSANMNNAMSPATILSFIISLQES